jgi:peptidoglycan-associated lipoprotein
MLEMSMRDIRGWRTAATVGALGVLATLGACTTGTKQTAKVPLIQAPSNCVDFNFRIYFEPKSDAITPQASKLIDLAQHRAVGCNVTGVVVVGLADAAGTPISSLELSKHRADAVTDALSKRGFTNVEFHIAALGQTGATTDEGDARPVRRRVDVSVHLSGPSGALAN